MEISTFLTIVGIIATTVFFILAIKRRITAQITFIKENSLGLFDSIVKNLPELAVLYKDTPVTQGLVLLKGFLLNTGAKDITESMVEEAISIRLPEGFKWLTGKVVSKSPRIQADMTVEPRELTFQTGLFRCNEHIRFEALAEVPIEEGEKSTKNQDMGKKLEKALEFSHRIADTQKIKVRGLSNIKHSYNKITGHVPAVPMLVIVVALGIMLYFKGWPTTINYLITTESNKIIEVSISPKADGTVAVRGVVTPYKETLTADEFFKQKDLKPKVVVMRFMRFYIIILASSFIIIIFGIFLYFDIAERKVKKLLQSVGISE